MNDPHDLRAIFYFEDSEELWASLLSLAPDYPNWDLNYFVDVSNRDLASKLNNLFGNMSFDSISGSLHQEIENNKKALLEIFSSHIRSGFAGWYASQYPCSTQNRSISINLNQRNILRK